MSAIVGSECAGSAHRVRRAVRRRAGHGCCHRPEDLLPWRWWRCLLAFLFCFHTLMIAGRSAFLCKTPAGRAPRTHSRSRSFRLRDFG